uniref:Uncharacterized protein n=1 Tax=Solanum lycopersicum TaxID=4081 RepID=A0A3Q7I1N2_SOLLC
MNWKTTRRILTNRLAQSIEGGVMVKPRRSVAVYKSKRPKSCYSFDLKSAIDRWTLINSSLGLKTFLVSKVAFLTGEPTLFGYYVLLGDDILITAKKVANQYSRLLDRLGVTISFAK